MKSCNDENTSSFVTNVNIIGNDGIYTEKDKTFCFFNYFFLNRENIQVKNCQIVFCYRTYW